MRKARKEGCVLEGGRGGSRCGSSSGKVRKKTLKDIVSKVNAFAWDNNMIESK